MTVFGLKEAEVATLVRAVLPDEAAESSPDREGIEAAFARATWSGIAEPGDGVAGALVASIGPARSLAALIEKQPADRLASDAGLESSAVSAGLDRWMSRVASASALLSLRQAGRFGARLRTPQVGWHPPLDDLGVHAPIALWSRGSDAAFHAAAHSIALVGARAATGYGEHVAMESSAGLVDRGFAIVSGAAYGIDGMAHRAALASNGHTIAFLAGGVDRFYPSGHDALLTRIVADGCVVSELPCGSAPTKWRFLQRNRLIAAASLATVVLEAGWRSGSLNTAHHAAELGRPLGAVPGPVTSPASAGCHRLLRESPAVCVTNADEMEALAGQDGSVAVADARAAGGPAEPKPELGAAAAVARSTSGRSAAPPVGGRNHDPAMVRVLDALSVRAPREVSELARRSGLSSASAGSALARLELDGVARETERGWQRNARRA